MIVVDAPDAVDLRGAVVSIGNFDGVHRGHRLLLERMRALAQELGAPAVVLTFFPPSRVVFGGGSYLSTAREKVELLGAFEPSAVVVIPFSKEYARTDKSEFVAQLERLQPSAIVVGEDFRFGHGRAGTLNDLSLVTPRLEVFALERYGSEPISSSRIRALLAAGDVRAAAELLGAPYRAAGTVVAGDRRGRSIGFPTANLDVPEGKALPVGVFSVRVSTPEGTWGGMANSGPRPTFPEAPPALEAHLFDFDGDLYGQEVTVEFVDRIREQRRFGSLDELRQQLGADLEAARRQLAGRPG